MNGRGERPVKMLTRDQARSGEADMSMTGVCQGVSVTVTRRHLGNIAIIPQNSVLPESVQK